MPSAPAAALATLGRLIDIPDLAFDAQGYCCLLIDEVTLSLEYDATTDDLLAYSHLSMLPCPPDASFYEMLLEGNFFCRDTAGATLGVDTEAGVIILFQPIPAYRLDGEALERRVSSFVAAAELWRGRIRSFNAQPAATGAAMAPKRTRI